MKTTQFLTSCALAVIASLATPMYAQFANPTSQTSFLAETPAGHAGQNVAIGGEFQFDAVNLWLRITIQNLSGTGDYADGYLLGFGFDTPYADNSGITLAHNVPVFHVTTPFDLEGEGPGGSLYRDVGVFTGRSATQRARQPGIAPGASYTWDFDFGSVASQGDPEDFSVAGFFGNGSESIVSTNFRLNGNGVEFNQFLLGYQLSSGEVITPVPEPATYGLAGILLIGGAIVVRRFAPARRR